jgi:hypothetical protein
MTRLQDWDERELDGLIHVNLSLMRKERASAFETAESSPTFLPLFIQIVGK